jgi:hypothetical protein
MVFNGKVHSLCLIMRGLVIKYIYLEYSIIIIQVKNHSYSTDNLVFIEGFHYDLTSILSGAEKLYKIYIVMEEKRSFFIKGQNGQVVD